MLYRNGENLKEELTSYLTEKQNITIFSPYIKSETLKGLLQANDLICEQIIVRWEPRDIAMGSSDLDIYKICKENNIALFMNNRIHLKLFTNDFKDAFLGSANISERAISNDDKYFNYEVCIYLEEIDNDDRLYLYKIINESILITDEIYDSIKVQSKDININSENNTFSIPEKSKGISDFLISKLPMLDSPELFWELYSGSKISNSIEQNNCYCHDLIVYNINEINLDKTEFFEILSENFLKLPFIVAFLEEVDNATRTTRKGKKREGLQFGAVRKWFAHNTTTVPSPRAFELTSNIQILYTWIEVLSNGKYSISVPGSFSQVIKNKL